MERKDYQKPTMKIVELQHQCRMLEGSEQEEPQGRKQQYQSWNW